MKYLTKKWYHNIEQALIIKWLKCRINGEDISEEKFQQLYNKDLQKFIKNAYLKHISLMEDKDFEFKELVDTSGISGEAKNAWEQLRIKLVDADIQEKFDEEEIKQKHQNLYEERLRIAKSLPPNILKEISDIRLFCLGYATKKVSDMVTIYSKKQKEKVNRQIEIASQKNAKLQFKESINFKDYIKQELLNIEMNEDNITFVFVNPLPLVINGGKIIKQEAKFNRIKQTAYINGVLGLEVQKKDEKYEIQFLIGSESPYGKIILWYLTIQGDNIRIDHY